MTTDELLQKIKDRASLPPSVLLADQKIIDAANSEFLSVIVPQLLATRQGYFRDYADQTIVSGQSKYPIPVRAIDSAVEVVKLVDASGNELWPLTRIDARDIRSYTTALPCFYLEQGNIILTPTPTSAGNKIRVYYPRRPGTLVLDTITGNQSTAVGVVAGISYVGGNSTITLAATTNSSGSTNTSGNHNGWPANTTLDIVGYLSPFLMKAQDLASTTAAAGTNTILIPGVDLTSSPYNVVAGDYVTLARTSWVPQIPLEWHEYLLELAAARINNETGDYEQEARMRQSAGMRMHALETAAQPRAPGNPKRINAWRGYRGRRG